MKIFILLLRFFAWFIGEIKYLLGIRKFRPTKEREEYMVGYAYYRTGKIEEAASEYKKFTSKYPENAMGWYFLGYLYSQLDNYEKAIEPCVTALTIKPELVDANAVLANCYISNNQFKKAKIELEKYLKVRPDAPLHNAVLANIYLLENELGIALKYAMKGFERAKNNPDVSIVLALIYHHTGQFDKSLELIELSRNNGYHDLSVLDSFESKNISLKVLKLFNLFPN